jgi:hypothetical protein
MSLLSSHKPAPRRLRHRRAPQLFDNSQVTWLRRHLGEFRVAYEIEECTRFYTMIARSFIETFGWGAAKDCGEIERAACFGRLRTVSVLSCSERYYFLGLTVVPATRRLVPVCSTTKCELGRTRSEPMGVRMHGVVSCGCAVHANRIHSRPNHLSSSSMGDSTDPLWPSAGGKYPPDGVELCRKAGGGAGERKGEYSGGRGAMPRGRLWSV